MPARAAASISSTISRRCASACRSRRQLAHRLDRDTSGCLVLGRHRKALARAGPPVRRRPGREGLLGGRARPPAASRGTRRPRAAQALRAARLVDGGGSGTARQPVTDYRVLGESRRPELAGVPAAHRSHASDPRSLRRTSAARCWATRSTAQAAPHDAAAAAPARPVDRAAALSQPRAGHGRAPPPPHMLEALRRCGYVAATELPVPQAGGAADRKLEWGSDVC